jgi:uncharacterized membrane protein YGL010W
MAAQSALNKYFKSYGSYHRTTGNKWTHGIGIPLIVMSLLGLLGSVPLGPNAGLTGSFFFRLDLGVLLWLVVVGWYIRLDWKIGAPFALVGAGLYFFGRSFPISVLWGLFVFGWVLQFVGHAVFEKESPAFLENAVHLLIGPLWIFARIVGYEA